MPSNARCGHFEYDKGHCGDASCPNFIQACTECRDQTGREAARPSPVKVADDLFDAAFGWRPGGTSRA